MDFDKMHAIGTKQILIRDLRSVGRGFRHLLPSTSLQHEILYYSSAVLGLVELRGLARQLRMNSTVPAFGLGRVHITVRVVFLFIPLQDLEPLHGWLLY